MKKPRYRILINKVDRPGFGIRISLLPIERPEIAEQKAEREMRALVKRLTDKGERR